MLTFTIVTLLVTPAWSLLDIPQSRTFLNVTSNYGSLAVVNKTNFANALGIFMTSAFVAGTLIYSLEEPKSRSDQDYPVLAQERSEERPKKKKRRKNLSSCDCDNYCSYYYSSYYSKR